MIDLSALHLIVLAAIRGFQNGNRPASSFVPRKMTAQPSLARSPQSCILHAHLIRRLKKLPVNETARASARTSGRTTMHHHVLRHAKSVALAGLLAVAVATAANA